MVHASERFKADTREAIMTTLCCCRFRGKYNDLGRRGSYGKMRKIVGVVFIPVKSMTPGTRRLVRFNRRRF
jgi:hypothetical protein